MGFQLRNHLAIVTTQDKQSCCCHTKNRQETKQITGNVCARVTKLSLNNASFHRKCTESTTTQTRGACDTCKQGRKGKPNHKSVRNSPCLGHDFKSVKQEEEWSMRAPRGRHIRMVSDVRRKSARVVGTRQRHWEKQHPVSRCMRSCQTTKPHAPSGTFATIV